MRRTGFASILAIVSIGLVAAALTALSMWFASDSRRTASAKAEAQIRQLLLAGASDLSDHARRWGIAPPTQGWSIRLPDDLVHDGAQLAIQIRPDSASSAYIDLSDSGAGRSGKQELE